MSLRGSYKNYISLGYFCSVAMELERIGLRSASYPFDWLVTQDMSQVVKMVETHFDGFLDPVALRPLSGQNRIYVNSETGFQFVHDFNETQTFGEQYHEVLEKFERRIDRFYHDIQEPTLFLRYISDEKKDGDGVMSDLRWIEKNHSHIIEILKSYNPDNDVIWIANSSLRSDVIEKIYHVEKDENDTVARRPLDKNEALRELLMNAEYPDRSQNLQIYRSKQKKKNSIINRIRHKLKL